MQLKVIKRVLLMFLLILNFNLSYSQIINIENKRYYIDTTKFIGNCDADVDFTSNTKKTLKFNTSLTTQYRVNDFKFLLFGNNELKKVNGSVIDNSGFVNFRIRYYLSKPFSLETFTQYQFDDDMKIDLRMLYGFGFRYKLYQNEKSFVIYSTNFMYENIRNYNMNYNKECVRLGMNITYVLELTKNIEISTTFYHQPNIKNVFNDFKFFNENCIRIKLNSGISLICNYLMQYNTEPITNTPKFDYEYEMKLSFDF
jgi:hypothetical protein